MHYPKNRNRTSAGTLLRDPKRTRAFAYVKYFTECPLRSGDDKRQKQARTIRDYIVWLRISIKNWISLETFSTQIAPGNVRNHWCPRDLEFSDFSRTPRTFHIPTRFYGNFDQKFRLQLPSSLQK